MGSNQFAPRAALVCSTDRNTATGSDDVAIIVAVVVVVVVVVALPPPLVPPLFVAVAGMCVKGAAGVGTW